MLPRLTRSERREIHPVHLMVTVGVLVGMLSYVLGIPSIFGRPAAFLAAALTLGVFWLRSRRASRQGPRAGARP